MREAITNYIRASDPGVNLASHEETRALVKAAVLPSNTGERQERDTIRPHLKPLLEWLYLGNRLQQRREEIPFS